MKKSLLIILLWAMLFSLYGENHKEEVKKDPRKDIILYGMESEVLALLGDLKRDSISSYNTFLIEIFSEVQDTDLLQAIFLLWEETAYFDGLVFARNEINKVLEDYDYSPGVVQSALSYVARMKDNQAIDIILGIIEGEDDQLAASAVKAISQVGLEDKPDSAAILLQRLKGMDNRKTADSLVSNLILALGELKYLPAADEIRLIVEDEASPSTYRQYACVALGKIGRHEDYEIIKRIYEESGEALLRSYALGGLAEFEEEDMTSILVKALKRDSYWRIRLMAAEKLTGKNDPNVQKLLFYKASHDPVDHVRIAALKSLGSYSTPDAETFLLNYFADDKKDVETRLISLNVLIENKVDGTLDVVSDEMKKLWEKDQGRFLEFICRELAKADWPTLAPLYERMLAHNNWLLVVYGIRGIYRNNLTGTYNKISNMNREGVDPRIRQEIEFNTPAE